MPRIRTLVVDDEPIARDWLRTLLAEDPDVKLVGECANGAEAVAAALRELPDLIFLDVQMPEKDGFQVLEELPASRPPVVVFVTAYDRYAVRAFDVDAVDYLLKPFDRGRFRDALARAKRQLLGDPKGELTWKLLSLLKTAEPGRSAATRLLIKADGRIQVLRVADIDWIEAAGHYVNVHAGKTTRLVRETMTELETRLPSKGFVRVHRGAIVNVDRIREIEPLFHGEAVLVLADGKRVTVSRSFRPKLEQALGKGGGAA
ncbi:MAG: LytTR family DNA-binding domain-containing protein [Thermoanaerobaculia bacterium]|jgi:two-component system LytT family response regulator